MRIVPKLFSLTVIIITAWMGANIYHDNDLFANPFKEQSVLEKIESRGSDFFSDKVEEASDAAKEKMKEGIEDVADKLKDVAEEF